MCSAVRRRTLSMVSTRSPSRTGKTGWSTSRAKAAPEVVAGRGGAWGGVGFQGGGSRRGGARRGRGGGFGGNGGRHRGRETVVGRSGSRGGDRVLAALDEGQDVLLGHATLMAGSGDLGDVHAGLRGDPPHDGGRAGSQALLAGGGAGNVFGVGGGRRGWRFRGRFRRRLRLGWRDRHGRGPARPVRVDVRNDRADLDGLAFGHEDLGQSPRRRGGDFGVHLVGGDLEDRFVALDGVADLLQPLGHRPLGDGLAHLGHRHFDSGHCNYSMRGFGSRARGDAGGPALTPASVFYKITRRRHTSCTPGRK